MDVFLCLVYQQIYIEVGSILQVNTALYDFHIQAAITVQ